ncbi:MAG TPA: hypothetical protein VMY43_01640 [Methanothrix sp.]|nr:hypothetical protein [Methanothrix sp.]
MTSGRDSSQGLRPGLASRAVAHTPLDTVFPINLGSFLVTYTMIGQDHGVPIGRTAGP